jgi:hypothetical protein
MPCLTGSVAFLMATLDQVSLGDEKEARELSAWGHNAFGDV